MQVPPQVENQNRLEAIITFLRECDSIDKNLSLIDQINLDIDEKVLPNLIDDAQELASILKDTSLKGSSYSNLIEESEKLESLINFCYNSDQDLSDRNQLQKCVEILDYVEKLHETHSQEAPIIEELYIRAEKRRDELVCNCCNQLEQIDNISTIALISLVDNLMICGKLNDMDLRLKFLQARDIWFHNECIKQEPSFDNIVSVHCKGLPMIFCEYQLLFCQDKNNVQEQHGKKLARFSLRPREHDRYTIINSWLLLKASIFISSLEVYLNAIQENDMKTPAMIGDTIQKCLELTNTLASIGFDFSSQLRPLFAKYTINSHLNHQNQGSIRR